MRAAAVATRLHPHVHRRVREITGGAPQGQDAPRGRWSACALAEKQSATVVIIKPEHQLICAYMT